MSSFIIQYRITFFGRCKVLFFICISVFIICFNVTDNVSCMLGPFEEYDIPLWSWHLSDVWRSDVRMSNLSQSSRETNSTLLKTTITKSTIDTKLKTILF